MYNYFPLSHNSIDDFCTRVWRISCMFESSDFVCFVILLNFYDSVFHVLTVSMLFPVPQIACVSPLPQDSSETINTLRYAMRAKKVKTNPIVRMDPRELLILSLKREVRLLRMENNYLRQQVRKITLLSVRFTYVMKFLWNEILV